MGTRSRLWFWPVSSHLAPSRTQTTPRLFTAGPAGCWWTSFLTGEPHVYHLNRMRLLHPKKRQSQHWDLETILFMRLRGSFTQIPGPRIYG
ncbi:hypothetical protein BX600DRAFT_460438 [Xylariales sp. PMI_506]|nr:hypothetical protein BX600DRAFT_460438 [Xylariales sp. PMI_506]